MMGALVSPARSDAQTEIARFHTENPTLFWGRNLSNFVASRNLSIADSARLSAMIWVAQADASIGCFDAKYHFRAWRPYMAIRAGDLDGASPKSWQDTISRAPMIVMMTTMVMTMMAVGSIMTTNNYE